MVPAIVSGWVSNIQQHHCSSLSDVTDRVDDVRRLFEFIACHWDSRISIRSPVFLPDETYLWATEVIFCEIPKLSAALQPCVENAPKVLAYLSSFSLGILCMYLRVSPPSIILSKRVYSHFLWAYWLGSHKVRFYYFYLRSNGGSLLSIPMVRLV